MAVVPPSSPLTASVSLMVRRPLPSEVPPQAASRRLAAQRRMFDSGRREAMVLLLGSRMWRALGPADESLDCKRWTAGRFRRDKA